MYMKDWIGDILCGKGIGDRPWKHQLNVSTTLESVIVELVHLSVE